MIKIIKIVKKNENKWTMEINQGENSYVLKETCKKKCVWKERYVAKEIVGIERDLQEKVSMEREINKKKIYMHGELGCKKKNV